MKPLKQDNKNSFCSVVNSIALDERWPETYGKSRKNLARKSEVFCDDMASIKNMISDGQFMVRRE